MHWIALQPDAPQDLGGQGPGDAAGSEAMDAAADPLTALAWQALQFTPKVARVALNKKEEALVMEISASERLFGGRERLLRLIHKKNKALAVVKYAQAATALVAIAKLQMGGERSRDAPCAAGAARGKEQMGGWGQIGVRARSTEPATFVSDSGNQDLTPICSLPLHTLAAAQPHLATLARIGCTSWGDVRALPRGGVVRRFGADLLDALDRAYGLKPEIYPWLTLPEVFEVKIELHAQVETAPALMFGAQRLFRQLQLWLQLRNVGVAALEFGWMMDARRNTASTGELRLRTAEPTQDISHLQRLLGENLARLTLPAPVLYLSLCTLETEPLATQSASLLLEEAQKGDSLHQMIERLSARLGAQNVLQLQARADHRPEFRQKLILIDKIDKNKSKMYTKLIANNSNDSTAYIDKNLIDIDKKRLIKNSTPKYAAPKSRPNPQFQPDALCPTWLLQQPLALAVLQGVPHYQGPLTLVAGPQRLEAGWWGEIGGGAGAAETWGRIAITGSRSEAKGSVDCALTPISAASAPPPPPLATPALRDYFIARSAQAGLLWVYRERLGLSAGSGAWYLHGRFD